MTTELYVSSILSHQVGDRNLYFFTSGIIFLSADRTLREYQSKTTKYLFQFQHPTPDKPVQRLQTNTYQPS
ncbi:hypothetical protein QUA00_22570 [Microcoleus sp. T2B6]